MQRTKRKTAEPRRSNKIQRRRMQQCKGMRLLRVWVPDTRRPVFVSEAERQARLLCERPEETEALRFIEAAFDWPQS